jgi:hypothetical protein
MPGDQPPPLGVLLDYLGVPRQCVKNSELYSNQDLLLEVCLKYRLQGDQKVSRPDWSEP